MRFFQKKAIVAGKPAPVPTSISADTQQQRIDAAARRQRADSDGTLRRLRRTKEENQLL
jgi:hypothetical protein